ncbi:hypothetical protein ABB55_27780 [Prosthecomicrobium hirschii]|uniref:Uncharacterized protein n=1 Tax=Prosthecodimorpha hirschii TaxID=665126 RepID=A0A0P6WL99_9HYPH|nr:hypothetical protein [Prosthecomicrobium hirschii]KPL55567.1 hypothetical protein ABB55_27780 [Prosthecomicrobium hirschii]
MAFVQSDLDALDAAMRGGVKSLRTADGKTIEYQSVSDYQRLRAMMLDDIAAASPARVSRSLVVGHDRG